ncbi:MAG TPA: MMPL family transporter [Candidatus Limnocylindrales bacterium]|jgi:RND superfamily putative drug exporter|nr:MMPL family transporter [Candidatus Limnocylindrales bacterium]
MTRPREPWTVRVAVWSARHRWPIVAMWFLLTIGTFLASIAAGGTRSADAVASNNAEDETYESAKAFDVFNASGTADVTHIFVLLVGDPVRTIEDPAYEGELDDVLARMASLTSTVDGATGPVFTNIVDPRLAPPEVALVSPDRTTVRIGAEIPGEQPAVDMRLDAVRPFLDQLRAAHPGLRIHSLDGRLANQDIEQLVNGGLDASLRLSIPLTFLILVIAFGAAVAAFVPLVLAVTSLLAAFGVLGLYSQLIDPVSPYASQLIVLIGLAVAVDYSLFMVTRYRTERRAGRTKIEAIRVASATAGRAVFFSGLAVMFSIGGLFLLNDNLFRSMAIGTISVVLIAVVGSLTFLPATLAILGDNVDRLRLPFVRRDRTEGSGLWAVVVRAVMRRPVIAFLVAGAALVAVSIPATRLHMGQTDFDSFPDSIDAVAGVNLLNEKWPQGSTLALQVVVTHADRRETKAAIDDLSARVLQLDGISGPPETRLSVDRTVALVSYVMAGGRNDEHNRDIVRTVRGNLVPAAFGGLADVDVYVTGRAAVTVDVVDFYARGMPLVMAFVLGLSFLLLLVAFRSIVIPIKAILLNLLSTGSAFGLLVLVFQDGRLAGALGFKPGPIESFVPVFIFTILFGLSMDYHVFILTRIKEARDHGLSTVEAVARGISITSGTVTSAAAIMVVVFSVFVTLELVVIKQLGFGLATAVLIDATIVRSVLLPATMRLLGDWNWWLPPFLRWLPEVTIEGDIEDSAVEPAAAAVHSPT